VWCTCENVEPPFARGTIFIKRRRSDDDTGEPRPEKWKTGTMRKAWRDFIVTQCYLDEQVLENFRLVQDPDLLQKMDEVNNFWK
jgi:hypothetical protein